MSTFFEKVIVAFGLVVFGYFLGAADKDWYLKPFETVASTVKVSSDTGLKDGLTYVVTAHIMVNGQVMAVVEIEGNPQSWVNFFAQKELVSSSRGTTFVLKDEKIKILSQGALSNLENYKEKLPIT
jgi:acyl-coenzyme A thioesterase PaaI-like protein